MHFRGFTMIEIMVVMVIVGVLAVMGGSNYIRSLSRGRDARRIEDMKTVQKGFEVYYSKNGGYVLDDGCTTMLSDTSVFPSKGTLMNKDYLFDCTSVADSYCICAEIENPSNYANSDNGCDFDAESKTHYCVKNVQ